MAKTARSTETEHSHFNANATVAALEEPVLDIGRFRYRGRLLSIEPWLAFWERFQELESQPVAKDGAEAQARLRVRLDFYRDYLYATFPRRDFRFWAPDPVAELLKQPFDAVEKAVSFFFILQARATFGEQALRRATVGTSSR